MNSITNPISASQREYLHTIRNILSEDGAVRAREIASRANVRRSSVTGALRALSKNNLINYAPYGPITLTKKGERIAKNEEKRFLTLKKFFIEVLSIPENEADSSARLLKRDVPANLIDRFTQFIEYLGTCRQESVRWTNEIGYHCSPSDCLKKSCARIVRGLKASSTTGVNT